MNRQCVFQLRRYPAKLWALAADLSMRVMILGGDGYLGWPTAMAFRRAGHEVLAIDNYLRRKMAAETHSEALIPTPRLPERAAIFHQMTGQSIAVAEGDCCDFEFLVRAVPPLCARCGQSTMPSNRRRPIQ